MFLHFDDKNIYLRKALLLIIRYRPSHIFAFSCMCVYTFVFIHHLPLIPKLLTVSLNLVTIPPSSEVEMWTMDQVNRGWEYHRTDLGPGGG